MDECPRCSKPKRAMVRVYRLTLPVMSVLLCSEHAEAAFADGAGLREPPSLIAVTPGATGAVTNPDIQEQALRLGQLGWSEEDRRVLAKHPELWLRAVNERILRSSVGITPRGKVIMRPASGAAKAVASTTAVAPAVPRSETVLTAYPAWACLVPGCTHTVAARQLCKLHYTNARRQLSQAGDATEREAEWKRVLEKMRNGKSPRPFKAPRPKEIGDGMRQQEELEEELKGQQEELEEELEQVVPPPPPPPPPHVPVDLQPLAVALGYPVTMVGSLSDFIPLVAQQRSDLMDARAKLDAQHAAGLQLQSCKAALERLRDAAKMTPKIEVNRVVWEQQDTALELYLVVGLYRFRLVHIEQIRPKRTELTLLSWAFPEVGEAKEACLPLCSQEEAIKACTALLALRSIAVPPFPMAAAMEMKDATA